jgi:hypothetical protein
MFRYRFKTVIEKLKQYPKSHLTSFLILHEVTAIVPIPIIYKLLQVYPIDYPISQEYLEEGNRRMNKMLKIVNMEVDNSSKQFLDLVTSYVIVKALMPARIALSLALTPAGARLIQRMNPFQKSNI